MEDCKINSISEYIKCVDNYKTQLSFASRYFVNIFYGVNRIARNNLLRYSVKTVDWKSDAKVKKR